MPNLISNDEALFPTGIGRWTAFTNVGLDSAALSMVTTPPGANGNTLKLTSRGTWVTSGGSSGWDTGIQGYAALRSDPSTFVHFSVTPGDLVYLSFYVRQDANNLDVANSFVHCSLYALDSAGFRVETRSQGTATSLPRTSWTRVQMFMLARTSQVAFEFAWGGQWDYLGLSPYNVGPVTVYISNIDLETVPWSVKPVLDARADRSSATTSDIYWTAPYGQASALHAEGNPTVVSPGNPPLYNWAGFAGSNVYHEAETQIWLQYFDDASNNWLWVASPFPATTTFYFGDPVTAGVGRRYRIKSAVVAGGRTYEYPTWTEFTVAEFPIGSTAPAGAIVIQSNGLDSSIGHSPQLGNWLSCYPAKALPFLTEFGDEPPAWRGSLQYRDSNGKLLAVHPYPETPSNRYAVFLNNRNVDYAEGLSGYPANQGGDNSVVFCGWESESIWRIGPDGQMRWRRLGFDGTGGGAAGNWGGSETLWPWVENNVVTLTIYFENVLGSFLAKLDATTGALLSQVDTTPRTTFYGLVPHPSGMWVAPSNGGTLINTVWDHGATAGVVTPWIDISNLELPYNYSRVYGIARAPDGTGFAVSVWTPFYNRYDRTAILEFDWSGNLTNYYHPYDPDSILPYWNGMWSICYSADSKYIYSVGEFSEVLWRFDRGPGNVGGGEPLMNLGYASYEDWAADGKPYYGDGKPSNTPRPKALWDTNCQGVFAYGPSAPAGGGWGAGVRMGGSFVSERTNLLTPAGAGFEDGTVGEWLAVDSLHNPISSSTDQAHTGTHSMKAVYTGLTRSGGWYLNLLTTGPTSGVPIPDQEIPVTEGVTYTFEAWYLAPAGQTLGTIWLYVYWFNSAGQLIIFNEVVTSAETGGAWTFLTGTVTAPTGAARAAVDIQNLTEPLASSWVRYFDDIFFGV